MTARTVAIAAMWVVFAAYAGAARGNDYLDDAKRSIAAGELKAARIQLKNAIRSEPENLEARYRLGGVYLALGDAIAAEREAKIAHDGGFDPDRAGALLARAKLAAQKYNEILTDGLPDSGSAELRAELLAVRGYAQLALNRPEDARNSFAQARRLAPNAAAPVLAEAKLLLALRNLKEAEALFDQAVALAPQSPEALVGKAEIRQRNGDPEGALRLLDRAIETNPHLWLLRLHRAAILLELQRDRQAESDIAAVLAERGDNGPALYLRAILRAKEKAFKKADDDLTKLSGIIGKFTNGYRVLAVVKYNLGQLGEAEEAARRHVGRHPDDAAGQRLLAQIELDKGRPDDALERLSALSRAGADEPATLRLIGRAELRAGRPDEAQAAFEKAIDAAPGDPALHYWLGVSRLQAGDGASGIEQIARSLDLAPTVPAAVLLVLDDLAAGRQEMAMQVIERLRALQPNSPVPDTLSGMVKFAAFDLAGARAIFAEVAAKHPDFAAARYNLARIAELQGKPDEARQLLEGVLAQQPANAQALTRLVHLLLRNGRGREAVEAVERARAAKPDDPARTSLLIALYLRLGDHKRALALARAESGSNDSREAPLIAERARAEVAAGLLSDAARTYRRLIAIDKSGLPQRRRLAAVLLAADDAAGAREALDAAIDMAPKDPRLVHDRIAVELKTGGVEAAQAWAKSYAKRHPERPLGRALEGDVFAAAGRYGEAAAFYEEAYRTAPSSSLVQRLARAMKAAGKQEAGIDRLREWFAAHPDDVAVAAQLGTEEILVKRYDEARRALETVVAKQPGSPIALNNLAWLYQLTGDPRALPLAKRAYALAPQTSEIAATLGWVLTKSGQAQNAIGLLRTASTADPGNPQIKYHLAVALNDIGERETAQKILVPLVAEQPEFDEKPAARRLLAELQR